MYKFDYCPSVSAPPVRVESARHLLSLFSSEGVRAQVERFRASGNASFKRGLPAVCFQAWFSGGRRRNEGAHASGLFMLDIDHVGDPRAVVHGWLERAGGLSSLGVLMVYVTPSGKGLKVVARSSGGTIAQEQQRLAAALGTDYDAVAHDLARLAFVSQADDILYFDKEGFEAGVTLDGAVPEKPREQPLSALVATDKPRGAQPGATYRGVPVREIAEAWLLRTGGFPEQGQRNTRLYELARVLRYICDFDAATMAANMPHFGLPNSEVLNLCRSAAGSVRRSDAPPVIDALAEVLQRTLDESASASAALPHLPPLFRELAEAQPPQFREAAVMAVLPCLGAVATHLRAEYLDGELHHPSFTTVIEAPQASGKSFTRRIVDLLLLPIRQQDAIEREKERAYQQMVRSAKNKKDQPTDPRACIRVIPASISIAKLLQRLDYAQGKHLFTFAEEIDTLVKTNRAGAWSQKTDIYRNAFDMAEYGQDYMSENSYSTIVRVAYNMLFCGTPRAVGRFYDDAENGLVSRSIFCVLPPQFGERMPRAKVLAAKDAERVSAIVTRLYNESEQGERLLELEYLNDALEQWLESRRVEAIKDIDYATDIFRRRAAVIGFRAGMLAHAVYNKVNRPQREVITAFSLWVAQRVMQTLVAKFGKNMQSEPAASAPTRATSLYDALPAEFTLEGLRREQSKQGVKSESKIILYRWTRAGFVKKTGKNTYVKLIKN